MSGQSKASQGCFVARAVIIASLLVSFACGRYGYDRLSNDADPTDTDPTDAAMTNADGATAVVLRFQDGVSPDPSYSGTRDTNILEDQPDVNVGTATTLTVDGSSPSSTALDAALLLRWDLTAIAAGATVETATIVLEVSDISNETYEVLEVLRPWVESEATWRDFASGQPWEVEGAAGALDRGAAPLGSLFASQVGPVAIPLNPAGIAVVQRWCDDPATNHGLLLLGPNNVDGIDADSRESATARRRPALELRYLP